MLFLLLALLLTGLLPIQAKYNMQCNAILPYDIEYFAEDCMDVVRSMTGLHYTGSSIRRFKRSPYQQQEDFIVPFSWFGNRGICEVYVDVWTKSFQPEISFLDLASSVQEMIDECILSFPSRTAFDFLGPRRDLFVFLRLARWGLQANATALNGDGNHDSASLAQLAALNSTRTSNVTEI